LNDIRAKKRKKRGRRERNHTKNNAPRLQRTRGRIARKIRPKKKQGGTGQSRLAIEKTERRHEDILATGDKPHVTRPEKRERIQRA